MVFVLIYWIFYAFASASFTQLGLSIFLSIFFVLSHTEPLHIDMCVCSQLDGSGNPFFALFDLIKASSDAIFPFALANPIFLLFSHHVVYSFLCIKTFSSSSTFAKCSWNVILVNAHKTLLYLNVCVCVVFGILYIYMCFVLPYFLTFSQCVYVIFFVLPCAMPFSKTSARIYHSSVACLKALARRNIYKL